MAPSTEAPVLPPIDENIVDNVQHEKRRGENNTQLSSNLCASQNYNTITDNSSTIDKSTAASAIMVKPHQRHTNIGHKKVAAKVKDTWPQKEMQ